MSTETVIQELTRIVNKIMERNKNGLSDREQNCQQCDPSTQGLWLQNVLCNNKNIKKHDAGMGGTLCLFAKLVPDKWASVFQEATVFEAFRQRNKLKMQNDLLSV